MDREGDDPTPRILRVMNPSLSEDDRSVSSKVASEIGSRFSFRSFSGSWSSLWRKENASRSHTEFGQDRRHLPSHGCTSFSTLLTTHNPHPWKLEKRFLIDGDDKVRSASALGFTDV